ncbi:TPA: mannose-1-phosphate guanylyltransferase/mannose-6-phosphate isomerase [Serratia marcescens]|uniref:Mannose-1-phosphate guanylyltransferase/mannose-6-phosphate isomerase n=1 Tax=Serratia nevei TaxID=2703794 RepID=A0ABT7GK70_9GAMM|nr:MULTISPECIES: mannose-1-phosphate guanylyltransferase/mannose-6-phosphate isomerase [Serratia]EGT3597378.1 mannose-1-phosphate guanylyltransferase/mannose-6-phosphate isomerase [Serratia marcescens]EHT9933423.1 mannose-1-phosphate guanylyltransferase/mannose-6-phosphate isomerase [Serratia marcescens]EIJ6673349.1 mannose-1-phosphate guanylyltransferase/mannose-6-phosphate isomerase [Serratia marcescens]EJC0203500.1 mannose-1-phosphate guanylyltransferase/mannose-6-phosphate isomerase [Serrat
MVNLIPVILAGGNGSRLWPLSREAFPKQFLTLDGSKHSLLQQTLLRLDGLQGVKIAAPIVICNEEHRFLVAEQLQEIDCLNSRIILEPAGRNTAPAVALAAQHVLQNEPDGMLLVLAADHLITQLGAFHDALNKAIEFSLCDRLVTFGIIPQHPETGYGYIKRGTPLSSYCFNVERFVEKPGYQKAQAYLESGDYCWNSGMFMFTAKKYLCELNRFRPDIFQKSLFAMQTSRLELNFIHIDEETFLRCPCESIDYAVMENTADAVVMPVDIGWSDVGSWGTLWDLTEKDAQGNVHRGNVIAINSLNNYVSSGNKLVATLGINNLVIIQTDDALLVAAREAVQDVKQLVGELKARKLPF